MPGLWFKKYTSARKLAVIGRSSDSARPQASKLFVTENLEQCQGTMKNCDKRDGIGRKLGTSDSTAVEIKCNWVFVLTRKKNISEFIQ